jgi:hypothetical protein
MTTFDVEAFDEWFWTFIGEQMRRKASALTAAGATREELNEAVFPQWCERLNRLHRNVLTDVRQTLDALTDIRWTPREDDASNHQIH